MLETKQMCKNNCIVVKPDINNQEQYIQKLVTRTIDISGCNTNLSINSFKSVTNNNGKITINGVETIIDNMPKEVFKCKNVCNSLDGNPTKTRYFSQTEQIQNIQTKCAKHDEKIYKRSTQGTPFGFTLMK